MEKTLTGTEHSNPLAVRVALTQTRNMLPQIILGLLLALLAACSSTPEPVAEFDASKTSGNAPLDVTFVLGESADADSFKWDFGDGTGSDEAEPSHTFQDAGTFTVRLTAVRGENISTAESTISVEAGEAGWIVIEGGNDVVTSLDSIQFSASAFDSLGNPISDPGFTWSVDEALGGAEIDSSGLFTAGTEIGKFSDAVSVEFERLGVVAKQTVGIEVTVGPLHAISLEPNELDIVAGRNQPIIVRAVDEAGHQLDSVLTLFTALRPEDEIDSTGLFTAGVVSSEGEMDLVSVEVELDGAIIEATLKGIVRPGILDQVNVSSLPTSLDIGESYQLSAFATDRFGNRLELDELRWTVSDPAIGSVTDTGLFTAGTAAGTYVEEGLTARAILGRVESVTTARVTIAPGPAETLEIFPDGDSVPIGAGSPFEVYAFDAFDNLIEIDPEEYEYEYSSAGRGNEPAVFIAGYELGDFENAITVKLPAGAAGNATELVAQSDISVRQRSSNIIAIEVIDQDGGAIMFIDLETAELGSADVSFLNNGAVEISPTWWPDGSRLVYVSSLSDELQVYSLHLADRDIVQLTDIEGGVSMPNVSPDGKSLAFVSLVGDSWQIYVAPIPENVASNPITLDHATLVSDDPSAQHILPIWSPDGTRLLATQNLTEGAVRILLLDPLAESPAEVIGPFGSVGFGWTPDSTGVHFGISNADGALDLGTLDLATLAPQVLVSSLDFVVAAWSPDDTEFVAIDGLLGAVWLSDSDGTGLRRAVGSDRFPTRMSWRPREYGDPVVIPVPEGGAAMLTAEDEPAPPVGALDTSLSYTAVLKTESGDVEIELFDDLAPLTVENFINLSRTGFYDGLDFHRVVPGFISQTGDNVGDETGGPGYIFNDEFSRDLSHDSAGIVSMANAGANTNGSQFFITHDAAELLDAYEDGVKKNCADDDVACHTVFGRVTSGIEIVTGLDERDPATAETPGLVIQSIEIVES